MGSTVYASPVPSSAEINLVVAHAMDKAHAKGLAIAVIENGEVRHVSAHGVRNEKGEPLQTDTVMYGASLTKAVLAYVALQLVDAGKLELDRPVAKYLDKPIYEYEFDRKYGDWRPLRDDLRWERITPRIALTHSTGFANFAWLEPDQRLRIHFDPGTRYGYSGQGIMLLQYVIEKGLGLDVGDLTRQQFERLGMTRTSLMWRADFAGNAADGWNEDGKVQAHEQRSRVRAAGSMDTTITDFAKFAAALVRGDGLSSQTRRELSRPRCRSRLRISFPR